MVWPYSVSYSMVLYFRDRGGLHFLTKKIDQKPASSLCMVRYNQVQKCL